MPSQLRADGVALENFDAVGACRTAEDGAPIDTSACSVDGTPVTGVNTLRDMVLRHQEQFVRSSPRAADLRARPRRRVQDMPLVRSIVRDAAADRYRFSSLVLSIVKSQAFQMNMKPARKPSARGGIAGERTHMFITTASYSPRTISARRRAARRCRA